MASTLTEVTAGNQDYQAGHMGLIFEEGFSFSGYERDGLFLNLEGEKFKNISGVSGIDSILDGRSAIVADFDNDGDADIFLTTIQEKAHQLFRNNVGDRNGFLRLQLEGRESGKDAFGAVVRVKTDSGIQTQIKSGGNGFLAHSDPRLLFGLGEEGDISSIEITWPSGQTDHMTDIPRRGSSFLVTEGAGELEPVLESSTSLPDPLAPGEEIWQKLTVNSGDELPRLSLETLEGEDASLPEEGAYLLNFWATWCGPCRREMPELQERIEDFRRAGIRLIGVNVDTDKSSAQVHYFLEELGITYPQVKLSQSQWDRLFPQGNLFVPVSILVGDSGRITAGLEGWNEVNERRLDKILEAD